MSHRYRFQCAMRQRATSNWTPHYIMYSSPGLIAWQRDVCHLTRAFSIQGMIELHEVNSRLAPCANTRTRYTIMDGFQYYDETLAPQRLVRGMMFDRGQGDWSMICAEDHGRGLLGLYLARLVYLPPCYSSFSLVVVPTRSSFQSNLCHRPRPQSLILMLTRSKPVCGQFCDYVTHTQSVSVGMVRCESWFVSCTKGLLCNTVQLILMFRPVFNPTSSTIYWCIKMYLQEYGNGTPSDLEEAARGHH